MVRRDLRSLSYVLEKSFVDSPFSMRHAPRRTIEQGQNRSFYSSRMTDRPSRLRLSRVTIHRDVCPVRCAPTPSVPWKHVARSDMRVPRAASGPGPLTLSIIGCDKLQQVVSSFFQSFQRFDLLAGQRNVGNGKMSKDCKFIGNRAAIHCSRETGEARRAPAKKQSR